MASDVEGSRGLIASLTPLGGMEGMGPGGDGMGVEWADASGVEGLDGRREGGWMPERDNVS